MASSATLPPLVETFPADKYPLREVGQGYTAQTCQGAEADDCAQVASEMLLESRTLEVSAAASVGSETSLDGTTIDNFTVADLPLPDHAPKTGLLILRNESIFPGMVGISLPMKGNLWVREDGTFNLSGFFRRQIPKFKLGLMMVAIANMEKYLDVYHAVYRPVVENAAARQNFQVIRSVLEAGLGYYKDDCPAKSDLLDLRSRVVKLRARSSAGSAKDRERESIDLAAAAAAAAAATSAAGTSPRNARELSTEEVMENRRRISDSKLEEKKGTRPPLDSVGSEGAGSDMGESGRTSRSESDKARKLKIAQQVVAGDAPKQKGPFRLWKSTGQESYDKSKPS